MELRPAVHTRPLEGSVHETLAEPYSIAAVEQRLELATLKGYPPLRLKIEGRRTTFTLDSDRLENVHYRAEAERGYADAGDLWSPGYFSVDLGTETSATLVASTDTWETMSAFLPDQAAAAERERRAHLVAARTPPRVLAWAPSSCSPPTSS